MLRTAVTIGVLVILLLVFGPVGLFTAWVSGSPRALYFLSFRGIRLLAWVAGIRLEVRGRERLDPAQNYLFVANHQSNLDPPLLLLATDRNIRALAKASVFRMPVFGSVMRSASFIPVQRDDRDRAVRAVDEAAAWGLRYANVRLPETYMSAADGAWAASSERLDRDMAMAELIMLALRLTEGIDEERFARLFGIGFAEAAPECAGLESAGLIERSAGRVRLTRAGLMLGDAVIVKLAAR